MANQGISYLSRNFSDYRQDLINYTKQYYPDLFSDSQDAAVNQWMIELNAAMGDNLSFSVDKAFSETQRDFAQEKRNIYAIARNMGVRIPGKKPSITLVVLSATIPVNGSSFDEDYCPVILKTTQIQGGGQIFELIDDSDFASPFSSSGIPNRTIIPNLNNNGTIINYTISKSELAYNGTTVYDKKVISASDINPFMKWYLRENNVLSITSIISLPNTNYSSIPDLSTFFDINNRWYEVESLSQQEVFIQNLSQPSDNSSIVAGQYIKTDKKFVTEYTDRGFIRIIFGSGSIDLSNWCNYGISPQFANQIGDFINNSSLGITPSVNTTLFVQYRVGGGSGSNLGVNVLTKFNNINISINGSDPTINQSVQQSLTVTNPVPALGGRDELSIEEVRSLTPINYSAMGRCVTIPDYVAAISTMPGEFGVPFRSNVVETSNKIQIYILSLDENSNLTNNSTDTLRSNLSEYLSNKKMINDYVEVINGRVYNIRIEVSLLIDKTLPLSQIIVSAINAIITFFDVNNYGMSDNIYLSGLIENLNNIPGCFNVGDINIFANVGGNYSTNEPSQLYSDNESKQIDTTSGILYSDNIGMYEIKNPNIDIKVNVTNG